MEQDHGASDGLLPELTFSTFILSLSTSALVHLGELPDPVSGEREVNLPLAQQSIHIIELLKEKTEGNLTPSEEKLLDDLLYDMRMKYVCAANLPGCDRATLRMGT